MKVTGIVESQKIARMSGDLKKELTEQEQITNKRQEDKKAINREELEGSLAQINQTVQVFHKNLKFRLHDESGRMYVEVFNTDDSSVIKTIPPQEMLDMLGRIKEMVGLLIDEKI